MIFLGRKFVLRLVVIGLTSNTFTKIELSVLDF